MRLSLQSVVIADDLTGAADTGVRFAAIGSPVYLLPVETLSGDCPWLAGATGLSLYTASRGLSAAAAAERVHRAAGAVRKLAPRWVYKKIDSTLRGHPRPELVAVMEVLGCERALVAPAFPAQGRTTFDGRQFVDGTPIEQTSFGHEVRSSDLLALFDGGAEGLPVRLVELSAVRHGPAAVCEVLRRPGPALLVADAETDADLVTLAQAAVTSHVRLMCGSAGLARALADVLVAYADRQGVPARKTPTPQAMPRPGGPGLVVAGSRHPRTARQVNFAQQRGTVVLRPHPAFLSADVKAVQGAANRLVESAVGFLERGRDVILTTVGLDASPLEAKAVATRLARVAYELAVRRRVGKLVLTGGDSAVAACAALGASALWLRGETQPGVPWGLLLGGVLPGLPVVTKAGGFGADNALVIAIDRRS